MRKIQACKSLPYNHALKDKAKAIKALLNDAPIGECIGHNSLDFLWRRQTQLACRSRPGCSIRQPRGYGIFSYDIFTVPGAAAWFTIGRCRFAITRRRVCLAV